MCGTEDVIRGADTSELCGAASQSRYAQGEAETIGRVAGPTRMGGLRDTAFV
jgi:hypothetical protein